MTAPLRRVETAYKTESFCGACERKLGGPYGSWYPHDGMRFCSFCGTELDDSAPVENEEGDDFHGGPSHPLRVKEKAREDAERREYDLRQKAAWMCRKCSNTDFGLRAWSRSHKKPTAEERLWNPIPVAHHGHRICPACKDETIVWIFDGSTKSGDSMMEYRTDEPQSGPLADSEVTS